MGTSLAERAFGDDESADVLERWRGKPRIWFVTSTRGADDRVVGFEAEVAQALGLGIGPPSCHQSIDCLAMRSTQSRRQAQRLADLAHRAAAAVGDDHGGQRGPVASVLVW